MPSAAHQPLIGITCDVTDREAKARRTYINAVISAGGIPILLPPPGGDAQRNRALARAHLSAIHALILTGGDDPDLTRRGLPNHPASTIMHPDRQNYEEALLAELDVRRNLPTLGICLGMQQMSLHAGGTLNPHLPDTTPTAQDHTADNHHEVRPLADHPLIRPGRGASWHHQAVQDPGRLRIIARAHDNTIEAIDDPARPFYLGIQWHPERTTDPTMGQRIFEALIAAAQNSAAIS
jgi:putative glutamine amidotransferase